MEVLLLTLLGALAAVGPNATNKTEIPAVKNVAPTEEDKLWAKVRTVRLTKQDFEDLYGNKSRFGLVLRFAKELMAHGFRQMSFNEIRRHFHLRSQGLLREVVTDEQLEDSIQELDGYRENLTYFQKAVIFDYTEPEISFYYGQEEIYAAERFVDRKFPESRRIHRIKLEEMDDSLNAENIVKVEKDMRELRGRQYQIIEDVILRSNMAVTSQEIEKIGSFFDDYYQ